MAFAGSGNDVEITLTAYDNITPILRGASAGMGAFVGDADRMVNSLARIGAQAAPILAVGAALYYAGQQASQVQQNVANLNAVLHATSDELAAIRSNGLALSQATQFTDAQILSAQRQLARGGSSAADLAQPGSQGVTGAALDLASATGQRDPTKAATSLTTAMTAFQLNQRDAAGAATILAQAIDTSVGSLDTQATALRQSGVVARAAGLDLRATATDIAALQNAGLQSSAGSSLQTFLARVESPSMTARKAIADLNLEFYNLNGTLKTIPELFDEIRMKTMGMTQEQSQSKLFDIFGQRGIRVAEIAQEQGGGLLVEQAQRMAELGEASDIAARKMDTFQGSASKAMSSINVLAVQTGTALVPAMKGAADEVLALANGLSNLNNIAPIIPQMALAVGGIFGASRIAGGLNDRADTRAKEAADAAKKEQDARFAAASQYSTAIAQAEFEADSKILSAHQTLTTQMQALDQKVFDQYVAGEEKVVAAMNAADAKRIASIEAVNEKTLSSIDQIDAAYAMSAETQIQRQALTFEKQNAYLEIDQAAAQRRLTAQQASGSTPFTVQRATQEIERDALAAKQVVDQEMLQRDLEIQQRIATQKVDITIEGGERQIQAINRSSQMQVDEILASANRTALANAEAAAVEAASYRTRYETTAAAAEASYMNKVGGVVAPGNALDITQAGQRIAEGSIAAGMSGATARSIAGNAQLAAGTVAVDEASFAAKSRAAFATAGSKITTAIGALFLPVTVALLANDFVIRPIEQALIDRAAKNDPQLNELHIQTRTVIDHPDDNYQTASAAIEEQTRRIQGQIKEKQAELDREQGAWTENVPFLSGLAHKVGGDSGSIGALKQQITSLTGDLADLKKAGDIEAVVPQKALSAANDEMATLIGRFKDGTISQQQMETQWAAWGATVDETTNSLASHDESLKRQGVTAEQIIAVNKRFADSEREVADSIRKAKEDAEATYKDALTQANQAQPLGVDNQTISRAYFGKNLDQSAATKVQQQDALKDIGEYRKAWTDAQQAVNQFDISKGIDSIAGMKQRLDDAGAALAKLGLANPALQGLDDIATSFSHITDAEKQAESAMDAYNLTLDKTNGYLGQLGKVQKDFDAALLQAEYANAAGRATSAQQELVANKGTIRNTLAGQQQALSANMALDVLGEVRNLPDFKALDDYMRDIVDKAPGGKLGLMATVTTNLEDVKRQLDTILADRHLTVTVDPNFSQFDPAIADRSKSWSQYYGNMGGFSPYDEPNQPPGGPPGAPPTGGVYAGLPPGTGVGVNQNWNVQSALSYKPVEYGQYTDIVRAGGGKGGPLDSTTMYNAFIAAMKAGNVNPLAALSTLQMENNFGTNESRELQFENNFSGIKFANQPGATRGSRSSENDNYAAFANPEDFFLALARNLSTGDYQTPYQQGNFRAIRQQYVAGNAPPSAEQTANINNTVDLFNKWMQQNGWSTIGQSGYSSPSGQFGGGAGGYSPQQINQSENLATQQSLQQANDVTGAAAQQFTGGGTTSAIYQEALRELGRKKDKFGRDVYMWCLEIVDDIMQQAGIDERGQHPEFSGTADQRVRAAMNNVPGAGRVVSAADARPGDIVGWTGENPSAGTSLGHIGVFAGGNQYIGTTQNGVQLRNLAPGAVFIRPDGIVAGGPEPGSTGFNILGTGAQSGAFGLPPAGSFNAASPNAYSNPYPERLYPTAALPALGAYSAQQGALDARGQGEMQQFFDRLAPVFSTIEADKAGFGPTGASGRLGIKPDQFEQQAIDNAALQDNLTLTTDIGKAIQNINSGLAVTPQMYDAIRSAAGPLGDIVVAQVQATEQLEQHTEKLAQLKETQQNADLAYQQQQQQWQQQNNDDQRAQTRLQWTRQTIDEQTQAQRTQQQRLEQDSDTTRQRNKTLDDRDIQDARQKQQWQWQDEQNALQDRTRLMQEQQRLQDVGDTTHKEALDDAFETQSRAFQDQQRILNFRGGQESIALQDARKQLDEQHRLTVENAQQTGGLYVSLGKGSATEAEATAFASQAAAIDDARKKADDLYRRQADANTRQQDAESKHHALEMFNLETEMLQSQRKHEDEIKEIDRTAERRHNAFSVTMFDLDTENVLRQRSHELITRQQTLQDTARQRSYEDTTFQIEQVRLSEQRRWQDADLRTKKDREDADRNYQTNKWQQQDIQQDITNAYQTNKKLNADQQQDEQKSISDIGKQLSGLDLVISKYDTLLKMFGNAANAALNAPAQSGALPSQPVGGSAIRRLGGNAEGTPFSSEGYSFVNERGGEIRFLSTGETILPAEQTKRLMEAVLGYGGRNAQQMGAPVVQEGNVTINLNDEELRVSPATAAKIKALVRAEMESNAPESVDDSWASRGGMRR